MKAAEILIISQIEEFVRNGHECYVTDNYWMNLAGIKKSAIGKALQRLEDRKIIIRDTRTVVGNGKANKRRIIRLRKDYQKVILNSSNCNAEKEEDAMLENASCYTEKQPIKEKEKIIEKKNNNKISHSVCLEEASSSKHIYPSPVRYY